MNSTQKPFVIATHLDYQTCPESTSVEIRIKSGFGATHWSSFRLDPALTVVAAVTAAAVAVSVATAVVTVASAFVTASSFLSSSTAGEVDDDGAPSDRQVLSPLPSLSALDGPTPPDIPARLQCRLCLCLLQVARPHRCGDRVLNN